MGGTLGGWARQYGGLWCHIWRPLRTIWRALALRGLANGGRIWRALRLMAPRIWRALRGYVRRTWRAFRDGPGCQPWHPEPESVPLRGEHQPSVLAPADRLAHLVSGRREV